MNLRLRRLLALSAAASVLTLGAACSSPAGSPHPSSSASSAVSPLDVIKVSGGFNASPTVTVPAPWTVPTTTTKVLNSAAGRAIVDGDSVEVNYYGVNGRTGKRFDDSFSRGTSAVFNLNQVVPGFKKGLLGQKVGSRVLVAMPGSDGYDSAGGSADAGIKVGDTLVFVIDILSVQLRGPEGAAVAPAPGLPAVGNGTHPTITVPHTAAPRTLRVQPLIKGTGKAVQAGDTINFVYTWVRWKDGKPLETTYDSAPASASLDQLLPGMKKGLVGQTVGSRVLLVMPPAEAFPKGNANPKVASTDTIVMVVDLLSAQSAQK